MWVEIIYKSVERVIQYFRFPDRPIKSAGLARKKKASVWSPLTSFFPRQVVSYRWSKNNILPSLCLASYLAANWLQKLETKHCAETILLRRSHFCSYVSHTHTCTHTLCVLMCVWYFSLIIYNKTKLTSCKMSVFVTYT